MKDLFICSSHHILTKLTIDVLINSTGLFGDDLMSNRILETSTPKKQKSLGRQVKKFDVDVWKASCKRIVKEGNMAKVRTRLVTD